MFALTRDAFGKARIRGPNGAFYPDPLNRDYAEFLEWNAKQATPLDLSDKPPEPPTVDTELNRIKEILAKADQDIAAAERWEAVLKFMRRKIRGGGI